jgi:integrase/recombinase XerD
VVIHPFGSGQKTSGRIVYIGAQTRKALWKYLSSIEDVAGDAELWGLNENALQNLVRRMGNRCGVHAHSHRFRHTFAINFLRNGGNVFELQRLLGHNSLDMVRHYLSIAESDAEDAHRRASPVDMWKL